MTARASADVTPFELERAGRLWDSMQAKDRAPFVLHAYGYPGETVLLLRWQSIGEENQKALVRSMVAILELLTRPVMKAGIAHGSGNQSAADDGGGDGTGKIDPAG